MLWPILVYGAIVALLIASMVTVSWLLGERHSRPARNQPYESGVRPTGSARLRFGAGYYLVALFFILFDIEAAIVLAWAVAFRELGWAGYTAAAVFIVTLALGLIYVWKLGALDWSHRRTRLQGDGE